MNTTAHWSAINELRQKHPTMEYVTDRRYVTDDGVTTSTGISASIPTMLALIEAIAGSAKARAVADGLGVADWDAQHSSASFALKPEHMKTFVRNTLSLWRRERVGLPVADGVDEVALGLTADAWSRTQLTELVMVGPSQIRTRHGLVFRPPASPETGARMLAPLPYEAPARVLETELPGIEQRYDRQTADIVTLVMEYPWTRATTAVVR